MNELSNYLDQINYQTVIVREQSSVADAINSLISPNIFDNGDDDEKSKDLLNPKAGSAADHFTFD